MTQRGGTARPVRVPGPRGLDKYNPRFQPHVLIIRAVGDGLEPALEWEVEHPDDCPSSCFWYPGARAYLDDCHENDIALAEAGHRDCYVQYELDNIGLDTLALGLEDDQDEAAIVDAEHVKASPFEPFWLSLRPGRYLIEGWYEEGRSYPNGYIDPDGGLTVIRRL